MSRLAAQSLLALDELQFGFVEGRPPRLVIAEALRLLQPPIFFPFRSAADNPEHVSSLKGIHCTGKYSSIRRPAESNLLVLEDLVDYSQTKLSETVLAAEYKGMSAATTSGAIFQDDKENEGSQVMY
jgi:hypothetical protein